MFKNVVLFFFRCQKKPFKGVFIIYVRGWKNLNSPTENYTHFRIAQCSFVLIMWCSRRFFMYVINGPLSRWIFDLPRKRNDVFKKKKKFRVKKNPFMGVFIIINGPPSRWIFMSFYKIPLLC